MSAYIRPKRTGATVFFTVNLAVRGTDLLVREIEVLRHAVRVTLNERPVTIEAWVVLPDYMQCVWTLPEGDLDFTNRWRVIKARFSRAMPRFDLSRSGVGWVPTHRPRIKWWVGTHPTRPYWPYSSYHRDFKKDRAA
jgi:putative transposase